MKQLYQYLLTAGTIQLFRESMRKTGVLNYPISANGSFYYYSDGFHPVGPTNVGKSETGIDKGYQRAVVGVVKNQFLVRFLQNLPNKPLLDDLKSAFGSVPEQYMGGGIMLINNSKKISLEDIISQQKYSTAGKQLETNNHILLGNKGKDTYMLVALGLSYIEVLSRVSDYNYLCMLDGGKAFWVKTPELNVSGVSYGQEPPYFAIGAHGKIVSKG